MKKSAILISILIFGVLLISNCNKDEDPIPIDKEKYAWVAGFQDSTGYGMILFTPDGGETWVRQGEGSAALQGIDLADIWAVDENNVWACGSNNTILRTTDGGQNWIRVQAPSNIPDANLSSIGISQKNNIWICGTSGVLSNGLIYKSTDSGNTWTMLDTVFFDKKALQGLWASNPEKIYVVGGDQHRGFIGYTLDGGISWDSIVPADDYNKWKWIGVASAGYTIVVYGAQARYIVSTDWGATWQNALVPETGGGGEDGADINDFIMLSPERWWGAFDLGHIHITHDGGATWTSQPVPGPVGGSFLVGIDTRDNELALVVGAGFYYPPVSPIIQTTNGGASWESKYWHNSIMQKVSFIKD